MTEEKYLVVEKKACGGMGTSYFDKEGTCFLFDSTRQSIGMDEPKIGDIIILQRNDKGFYVSGRIQK